MRKSWHQLGSQVQAAMMATLLTLQARHNWKKMLSEVHRVVQRIATCGLQLTSTRAPLLMLRGAARLEVSCMRPLETWSMPLVLVTANPLGAAEVLALVLTLAVSLKVTRSIGTRLGVCAAGQRRGKAGMRRSTTQKQNILLQMHN